MRNATRDLVAAALVAGGLGSTGAGAVYVNGDGTGQALIFPYYGARGNPTGAELGWNTYVSVVNHAADTKVVRVRFREGRNAREVLSYNLYLAPNDVWTGVVMPSATTAGARFITVDRSCTNPRVGLPMGDDFRNAAFSGANSDGLGEGLDRTREGYFEMIEMATLTGAPAVAAEMANGVPQDCPALEGTNLPFTGSIQPPTGGLSGTLTLIQISTGMDFTVNATALADLTTLPFYRNIHDPYPDFDASEVRPVTHVTANGTSYKLDWTRGIDAVSAALMNRDALNEFVLEPNTASQTDLILTYPTRRFYLGGAAPFGTIGPYDHHSLFSDRAARSASTAGGSGCGFGAWLCVTATIDGAAVVVPIDNEVSPAGLLESQNRIEVLGQTTNSFTSGWRTVTAERNAAGFAGLASEATSTATGHVTGATTTGRFMVEGMPMVGFMVRTFRNGLLTCATGTCQGNYGGAFSHRFRRSIVPITVSP